MKKKFLYVFLILELISTIFLVYYHHKQYNMDDDYIVYIVQSTTTTSSSASRYYSKYHLAGCDYMFGTPVKVTLNFAKQQGYGSCPKCDPSYRKIERIEKNTIWIDILEFITTICIYLTIPIFLKFFLDRNFTNRQISIISIINSLIMFLVIIVFFENDGVNNISIGLMTAIINYFILKIQKEEVVYTTKIN